MESQPQNPEFRINPENFHPCQSSRLSVQSSSISLVFLCFCVCSLLACGHLLGKGCPLGSCR